MNLFTRNSLHYHLLKYLLFLLKHPVYSIWYLSDVLKLSIFDKVCFYNHTIEFVYPIYFMVQIDY